jgi:energy-coupling factor transporter ATP-binding protein EcfA2
LLTVDQALSYAARLRLPDDTGRRERRATVDLVLAELGLTEHARTRIDRLSGGQRKRVSIALELLTSPSLLLLDEPTSGLDPALERAIMESLRALADAGRTVVVVTHSPVHLGRCDKVLLLAAGGVLVYAGPPSGVLPHFGCDEWADVYSLLTGDPDLIRHASATGGGRSAVPVVRRVGATAPPVGWRSRLRQARTLAARHATLVAADRGYVLFLVLLPALLATLALVVPGGAGLRTASPGEPGEAGQVLVLLFVGAAFAGGAIAAREVIGERAIVLRERAAGVGPGAYAMAKLAVFALLCAVESTLLIAGLALVKPMPVHGVLSVASRPELAVAVWCTALASSQLSVLCSALARSAEQVMPLLVITVMTQLVLCGGLIPVTGRPVVSQLSWLAPSRWGYAAGAATADLRAISPVAPTDRLWAHATGWWLLAVGVLVGMTGVFAGLVAISIRRLNRI